MSVYPYALDSDQTIFRIDDNLSELGTEVINQQRDAIFAIEQTLGILPQGSQASVSDRLNISLNADGTIKSSALTSVGLATLPIVDNQVANNAGIKEFKLSLDFSTSSLNSAIVANTSALNALQAFYITINSNLTGHINGSFGRHLSNQIDLGFVLLDKTGSPIGATTVASALQSINTLFNNHQNATSDAHVATAIEVDTSTFVEIPDTANNVQLALEALDGTDRITIGYHQTDMHSNGIPRTARAQYGDGYSTPVVPRTSVTAYLVNPPSNSPVDNNINGDDIISFNPNNDGYLFDSYFSQVRAGDVVRIDYGNGFQGIYRVDSFRFVPGSEWLVRIDGINLCRSDGYAYARIDRPLFEPREEHVLALAPANNNLDPNTPGSLIVAHPRGASAFGLDFDPTMLDSTHYNLYINLYPTGNPADKVITLPQIDVTGNLGATPGDYTLQSIVDATNSAFRAAGFNYRFIAFEREGNFGIALCDDVGASFSIINGQLTSSLTVGSFTNNVVGDASDGKDALGFGAAKAKIACPNYTTIYSSSQLAANYPIIINFGKRNRHYVVNGIRRDDFGATYKANSEGYWDGYIENRLVVGVTTVETTYRVLMDLSAAGLSPGKTILVQNVYGFDNGLYDDVDYGRFFIKSVSFTEPCGGSGYTDIVVLNSIHAEGVPVASSGGVGLPVKLYFGYESVGFNALQVSDVFSGTSYLRYHEVFVTDEGQTFSNERARMPIQTETSDLLAVSSSWKIDSVSSKLRGYDDTSTLEIRRYIRFYVLNFDATTGEYDGYIGSPVFGGPGLLEGGPVVRVKKGFTGRYFTNSYLDYVDIRFEESSPSAGTNILSSALPRYVDIEIFQGFDLDQEVMCLGAFTVDGKKVVNVRDCREFGNTSEKDFTDSAKLYIEAGERFLHSNGVVQGFEYLGLGANAGEIKISGGLALVDGKFVPVNGGVIKVPEIINWNTSAPQNLDWMLCVNKEGNFVFVLRNIPTLSFPEGIQRFMKRPAFAANYYVDSLTITQLIDEHPELLLLHNVGALIASATVTRVLDARKFVQNDYGFDFTLSTDKTKRATVRNWGTLRNIAGRFSGPKKFKLTGEYLINSSQLTFGEGFAVGLASSMLIEGNGPRANYAFVVDGVSVSFTGDIVTFRNVDIIIRNGGKLSGSLIFENCNIYVQSCDTAIEAIAATGNLLIPTVPGTINHSLTARNSNFTWIPTTSQLVTSQNPSASGAMILATNLSNIKIEGCSFNAAIGHAPFVRCDYTVTANYSNILFNNNIVTDTAAGSYVSNICFALTNSSNGTFSGISVTGNRCNSLQTVLITQGVYADNCVINNNLLGFIGYDIYADSGMNHIYNLTISKNNVVRIYRSSITGSLLSSTNTASGSQILVSENNVSQVYDTFSSSAISNIKLLNNIFARNSLFVTNTAMLLQGYNEVIVEGNSVGLIGDLYETGLNALLINTLRCSNNSVIFGDYGIYSLFGNVVLGKGSAAVTNNKLSRSGDVTRFIELNNGGDSNATGLIERNWFNDGYIDIAGTNSGTIYNDLIAVSGQPNTNVISSVNPNNLNSGYVIFGQVSGNLEDIASDISGARANVSYFTSSIASNIQDVSRGSTSTIGTEQCLFKITYDATGSPVYTDAALVIPMSDLVPLGSIITQISCDVVTETTSANMEALIMFFQNDTGLSPTKIFEKRSPNFTGGVTYTLLRQINSTNVPVLANRRVNYNTVLVLAGRQQGGARTMRFQNLNIKFIGQ